MLAATAVIAGILNAATDGWFYHYIYKVPQYRQFHFERFVNQFLVEDIIGKVPILFIGSIAWVFVRNRVAGKRTPLNIWEWTLPAALLASALPRSQPGGFENNLLPFFLWCSIMFGLFVFHLPGYFERLVGSADTREAKRSRRMQHLIVANFLLAQLILIFFIPTVKGFPRKTDYPIIPSAADRQAGENLVAYIKSFPGEVYLPVHNYYAWMAGKTPGLILSSSMEHLKAGGALPETFHEQLKNHHFDAVIVNEPFLPRRISMSYEKAIIDDYYWAGNIPYESRNAFLPATGLRTRPDIVMLPFETLRGIEGKVVNRPFKLNRGGKILYAFFTTESNLYLVDPVEFTAEKIPMPFEHAAIVGATDDGQLALMTRYFIFMSSWDGDYDIIKLQLLSTSHRITRLQSTRWDDSLLSRMPIPDVCL